ncbi:BamA/TamA family outer membrane protein [Agaribacterium haliotis]|uniref:BamA/TamA family outer membrane protein n=1 Tax=Agaribacterium haliotis TaxID=2013869 RepID=UPI0013045D93|nr:BamA/TamA family outer membrane protein [Agaribacterium haliotis]
MLGPFISANAAEGHGDYRKATESTSSSRALAKDKVQESKGAWMAVPIPFANPTIGAGLQAALLYMHAKKDPDTPNATSGVGGMYSDTDSYFVGAFHDDYWDKDRYRFTFLYGYGNLNLNYYGSGNEPILEKHPIEYNLEANGLYTKFLMRIGGTEHWYGGLKYVGSESTVSFDLSQFIKGLPVLKDDLRTSGLGWMLSFDSKDDNYYPTTGQSFNFSQTADSSEFGSDFSFRRLETDYRNYLSLNPAHVLALKAQLKAADGHVPFFMEPTLSMRGFDTSRYRDMTTLSLHAEWRWRFLSRWGMVAFTEGGATAKDFDALHDGRKVSSAGLGLRWRATKAKQINLGIDLAFSKGQGEIYIRAGEAF